MRNPYKVYVDANGEIAANFCEVDKRGFCTFGCNCTCSLEEPFKLASAAQTQAFWDDQREQGERASWEIQHDL